MSVYDDVFRALTAAGVPFVVVGGVAVVLHGHARMTVDLDLVIDLASRPAAAAIDVLLGLGLVPRLPVEAHAFADPEQRKQWVEQRNLQVFSMYDPANPLREVDLFATEPIPFHELHADAAKVTVGQVPVRIASLPHLLQLKRQAGRPQDLEDIAALTELQGGSVSAASDGWDVATHEGARRALRREVAALTPDQRLQWLDDALTMALASGALERSRERRQQECHLLWAGDT